MDALNYLLLVNIYLVLFYGFYALFLKNETFFKLNRIYLVGGSIMSFLIPFLQSEWIRSLFITKQVEEVTQNITLTFNQPMIIPAEEQPFDTGRLMLFIYLAGATLCLLRFLWQLYKVRVVLKSGETDHAFSFFNQVKVGSSVPNRETVFGHELVHARQWHSADVILFEIISIINWFNPVVYLYRKAIKHIHEFTADEVASHHEESKSAYAMVLLSKTFGISAHQLTNSFYNQSLLKRRIIMLHKSKSTRNALLKYGLSVPLFAAMMVLSSATISDRIEKIDETLAKDPAIISGINITTEDYSKPVLKEMPMAADTVPVKESSNGQDTVLTKADVSPVFPGGMKAFYEYLSKNFKYPEEARKNNISGKIILQFVVETDGKLSDIKVVRGLGSGLDEEAVKVLTASPSWKPGLQNGKLVRVAYTLPISVSASGQKTGAIGLNINKDNLTVAGANLKALYIVDGKEIKSDALGSIDPNSIKSINVLKDESAIQKYGDKGRDGVIEIYIKNTPPVVPSGEGKKHVSIRETNNKAVTYLATDSISVKDGNVTLSGKGSKVAFANYTGLIFLNGIEKPDKSLLKTLDPNTIESISVLKGESAIKKYGDRGKDGAIEITSIKK